MPRSRRSRPLVLVLTPDFPPARGGIQAVAHHVAAGLNRCDVQLVAMNTNGAAEFDATVPFPVTRAGRAHGGRVLSIAALSARGLALAGQLRPDAVLNLHIVTGAAVAAARRLFNVPFVQYVHAKEMGARPGLASLAMRTADRVIAVSSYARTLALDAGAAPERIRLIHPGVSLPERVVRTPSSRPTILSIARLEDRYKGHDVLMRAMPMIRSSLPDVQWIVIGDGPLRCSLEDSARAFGVDECVSFLGTVSNSVRDHWLSSAHVLVMASRMPALGLAGEGFGIVYLEANAHGIPAIGGNVGGAPDAIVDGHTGLLVDPTDPLDLAAAVSRLLRDRPMANQLGEQGRQRAQEFAWPIIASKVEDVLFEMIGR